MQPDQDLINRWSGSAQYWEKHREIIRQMFAPVTQALVEDGRISTRQSVLDVATGPGEPALVLASLVGAEGKIVGIDPVPEMVAAARRAVDRQRLGNVRFEVAFADHLPFPDESFDAVVSRFGAMFFPAPIDAIREMLRVLRPGGKLALAVWNFADRNLFLSTPSRILEQYVESPPPEPDAPDTFRFAGQGKLRDILRQAGVMAPSERLLQFAIQVPLSAEDCWTLRREMSEKLRESIATLSQDQQAEVQCRTLDAFRKYATGGVLSFPSEVLIVSGSKGRPA